MSTAHACTATGGKGATMPKNRAVENANTDMSNNTRRGTRRARCRPQQRNASALPAPMPRAPATAKGSGSLDAELKASSSDPPAMQSEDAATARGLRSACAGLQSKTARNTAIVVSREAVQI